MSSKKRNSAPDLPTGWLDEPGHKELVLAELAQRAKRRRRRRMYTAAATACLMAVVFVTGTWRAAKPVKPSLALSAPLRDTLPDGSIAERKDDATYTTEFDANFRRVTITRGTVHFDVTKNPQRPFVVTAGGVTVRAVGTAFSVELGARSVEVLVTEGRVAVASEKSDPAVAAPATVDAGSGVQVDLASVVKDQPVAVQPVDAETMESKLAWRARLLDLSGAPLAEVVRTLNQQNRVHFTIADAALGEMKLSGLVRADRIAGFIQLLEEEGVHVERRGDTEIVLRKN